MSLLLLLLKLLMPMLVIVHEYFHRMFKVGTDAQSAQIANHLRNT